MACSVSLKHLGKLDKYRTREVAILPLPYEKKLSTTDKQCLKFMPLRNREKKSSKDLTQNLRFYFIFFTICYSLTCINTYLHNILTHLYSITNSDKAREREQ